MHERIAHTPKDCCRSRDRTGVLIKRDGQYTIYGRDQMKGLNHRETTENRSRQQIPQQLCQVLSSDVFLQRRRDREMGM